MTLRCTVRGCREGLAREGDRLVCSRGHAFDRAREGYWNLLQPQDRKAARPGDRDEALSARRRWLARGFADGLVEAIVETIGPSRPAGAAIDVGCGEGSVTARVFRRIEGEAYGVDLSARALRLAARSAPGIVWIAANADRELPFVDASAGLAVSVFGRRPGAELARVLRPDGALIVVVPGEDDLAELREAAQGRATARDRVEGVLDALAPAFALRARRAFAHRARHDRAALADALAMTYRGARSRERERIAALDALEVTLSAEILSLARPSRVR
ncbi:MAG TPA: methyltransferase domain-containing protein [Candidatus Polarisedimenticolaceae bacterium]|nr:methyltransferase domain-containing protein [Candidatus Polarisedimenticolaceae bacterium]